MAAGPGELSTTQIEVLFKLPDLGPVEEGLLVFGPMPMGSYLTSVGVMDTDGTLDEVYGRLHRTGPEFEGRLSNHGPIAAESMARRRHA